MEELWVFTNKSRHFNCLKKNASARLGINLNINLI